MCVEDMSYIADARRKVVLVIQQLWGEDSDDAFVKHVEQVLSPDANSNNQVTSPIHALLGIFVRLNDPGVLERLSDRILELVQPLPVAGVGDETQRGKGKGKQKAANDPGSRAHFKEQLKTALRASYRLMALQRRWCLASFCAVSPLLDF